MFKSRLDSFSFEGKTDIDTLLCTLYAYYSESFIQEKEERTSRKFVKNTHVQMFLN